MRSKSYQCPEAVRSNIPRDELSAHRQAAMSKLAILATGSVNFISTPHHDKAPAFDLNRAMDDYLAQQPLQDKPIIIHEH